MADTPEHEQSKTEIKSETSSALPAVESPSISPAVTEPTVEKTTKPAADTAVEPVQAGETVAVAPLAAPTSNIVLLIQRIKLRPRHKRYAVLAASVALAASVGAVVGSLASGGLSAPKQVEAIRVDESQAMQQTVARLSKELTALKANVEAANKTAHTQIAKISERLTRESAEITGSISAPQTVPAQPPLPVPRPVPRAASVETQTPSRPSIVADWSIRDVRDGYVFVQGHGDIYQVSIGAPLPGLGAVEQVKRLDGRWMVVTPKGLIVSQRDRRYFE